MGGVTTATDISGSLDAKNIVLGVLTKQIEMSNLSQLCSQVQVPELTANIPIQTVPAGDVDLTEWETSNVNGADFSYVSFSLKKDRVKLGVSDEARYKSKAGDPLALQKQAAAQRLAYNLDSKVVTALQTTPQTGAVIGVWNSGHPIADIGTAVAAMRPFKADFAIMTPAVWAIYCGNADITGSAMPAPSDKENALARIPGFGIDVYVSSLLTAKTVIVGASQCPAACYGIGPVKVRQFDSENGGEIYQMDFWRQVVAPILKNPTYNMGCYVLTGVIT